MLPTEIHIEIMTHLKYSSLEKLRCVNRYFARIIELDPFLKLKKQYIKELFAIEYADIHDYLERPSNRREDFFYRCFECFEIKAANNFDVSHRDGMMDTDIGSIKRFCIECGIKGRWEPGAEVRFFLDNKYGITGGVNGVVGGRQYIFCGACKELKESEWKGGPWKECRDCWFGQGGRQYTMIEEAFEVKPESRYKEKVKQVMEAFQHSKNFQRVEEAPQHLTEEGARHVEACQRMEEEVDDLKLADMKLSHSLELYALWKDAEAWRKSGPGGHQVAIGGRDSLSR